MAKEKTEWDIFSLMRECNSDEFFNYLEELVASSKFDKLFRVVKWSGVFVTYSYEKRDHVQISKIIDLLLQKVYTQCPNEVEKLFNEVKVLTSLKEKTLSKENMAYGALDLKKQAYFLAIHINNYLYEMSKPEAHLGRNESDIADLTEAMILSFGMILKDMKRKKIPFEILPELPNSKELYLIGKHLEIATELRAVNDIIEIWMYSEIEIDKGTDKSVIKIYEKGNFGKEKLMTQIPFLDLKEAKTTVSNFFPFSEIESYIATKKKELMNKIQEYLYTNDFTQVYKSISLNEWINAYWCIYECALRTVVQKECPPKLICHTKEEWQDKLIRNGVSKRNVKTLLNYLIFDKKTSDVYDSPLVEFPNQVVCIPSLVLNVDISRSFLSIFGIDDVRKDSNIQQKGTNFEKHIEKLTKNISSKVVTHLFRDIDNKNKYELDLAFCIDEDLFLVEAKTQKQPGSYKDYQRNQDEFDNYLDKFNRNANYFMDNSKERERILKSIGMNAVHNVYKIFVSNVYQVTHFLKGIYIIDEIDYYNFMKRNVPRINYIDHKSNRIISINKEDSHLYLGNPTSEQLLKLIENPGRNKELMKRIGTREVDLKKQLNAMFYLNYIKVPSFQLSNSSFSESMQKIISDYFY